MHHALGQTSRARGVHDVQHVIIFSATVGLSTARAQAVAVIGRCKRLASAACTAHHMNPLTNICLIATMVKLTHGLCELIVKNECLHASIFQYEFKFVSYEPPVEWHHNTAYLGYGKKRLHELDRIHEQ